MKKQSKGVTVLEFALVLPLLFLLVFGIMEFGYLFFVQHTLEMATREGARLALVGGTITEGGNQLNRVASVVATIRAKASIAVPPGDVEISIYPVFPDSSYSDPVGWQTTQNAGLSGSYMRVRTRYTHHFMTPVLGNFFTAGNMVVQAQATYRNELF